MAAMLVLLFHACREMLLNGKYWHVQPIGKIFDFGSAGVDFFFVLSGFVILYSHWHDVGRPERASRFLRRRFLRVFPLYWMVLLPLLLAVFAGMGDDRYRDPGNIAQSVLLVQWNAEARLVLSVAWTLVHEIAFYFLFFLVVMFGRVGWAILALWFLLAFAGLWGEPDSALLQVYGCHLHLSFAMGMACAWVVRRTRVPAAWALAIVGILGFMALGADQNWVGAIPQRYRDVAYGASSALILWGLAGLERAGNLRTPEWMVALGAASYSIYLVHFPLMSLGASVLYRVGTSPFIAMLVFIGAGVGAGLATHRFVERPFLNRFRQAHAAPSRVHAAQ